LPAQALSMVISTPTPAQQVAAINSSPTPNIALTRTQSPTEGILPTSSPTNQPTATRNATLTSLPTATAIIVVNPNPTSTPMPTPVGGGEGQIAFASDRSGTTQVWIMNVDGSDLHQVTDMPEGACQPEWSPDGMSLAFISPCDRNQEQYRGAGIFIINADGSGLMPLPSVPGGDYDPSWSPDGKEIAFTSLRNGGRTRIFMINLADGEVERLSGQYSYDRQPSWSLDGSRLAFVTTQKGPVQVWTMGADGGNQELFSRSADAINSHPVWSVDGELILFTQVSRSRRIPSIVAASYKDGEYSEFRYEIGPVPVREANYSQDGLWLVFESWPEGSNHDIYIMTASGAARTRLTDWPGDDFDPVWRPVINSAQ
jgi:eukaryotic-like serine/threonine-protein kinase